jgi:hypothetical protein
MKLERATQQALDAEVLRLLTIAAPVMKRYPMREVVTGIYAELVYDPAEELELGTDWLAPLVDAACVRLKAAGMASLFADGLSASCPAIR